MLIERLQQLVAKLDEYKKKAESEQARRQRLEEELEMAMELLHELAVAQGWEIVEEEVSEDEGQPVDAAGNPIPVVPPV